MRCQILTKLIGPKSDKSGTFSDQISVHFGSARQNVQKSDQKKSLISTIWGQSDLLCAEKWHPCLLIDWERFTMELLHNNGIQTQSEIKKGLDRCQVDFHLFRTAKTYGSQVVKGRQHGNIVARTNFGSYDLQKIFGGTNLKSKKRKKK